MLLCTYHIMYVITTGLGNYADGGREDSLSKYLYAAKTLTHPSQHEVEQCQAYCVIDDHPCLLFVIDYPDCYLGNPSENLNTYSVGTNRTVYLKSGAKKYS